jgi:hypothetical protein
VTGQEEQIAERHGPRAMVQATFKLEPEAWTGRRGLDRFSVPMLSFRSHIESLIELVETVKGSSDPSAKLAIIIRAIKTSSATVGDSEITEVAGKIAAVFDEFSKFMFDHARSSALLNPRVVNVVEASRPHEIDAERGTTRTYRATAIQTLKVDGKDVRSRVHKPIAGILAPYCISSVRPSLAAAEVGMALSLGRSSRDLQAEAALTSGVASFESFLRAMVKQVCKVDRNIIRDSRMTFSAPAILDAKKHKELRKQIRRDYVNGRARSFDTLEKFFTEFFGTAGSLSRTAEIIATRNVIVHHAGRVSAHYLALCPDTKYVLNDQIIAPPEYVLHSFRTLLEVAATVANAARARYPS